MSKTIYITTKALRMILKKYCNLNLPRNTKFVLTTEKEKANEENYVLEEDKIEYTDTIKFVETSESNIVAEEIERLKEELAQKESELEEWKKLTNIYKENLKFKDKELAEKEKEIEQLKDYIGCKGCIDLIAKTYQDKIKFAIEQLEKVKEKLIEELRNVIELLDPLEYEDYHEFIGCGRGYKNSIEEINNQILELKKEMK